MTLHFLYDPNLFSYQKSVRESQALKRHWPSWYFYLFSRLRTVYTGVLKLYVCLGTEHTKTKDHDRSLKASKNTES